MSPDHSTLLVVRALTSSIDTVDEFARVLCTVFWALVNPSLERAREVIRDKLKMRVSELLDELRAAVSAHAAVSAALPEFSLAVARTSAEVQRALGDAEAWFNRPDVQQAQQLFSLDEAVDVSIESARKLHRAFQPDLEVEIAGELSLSAGDLVFLTDAMFIAFSNIRAYSGDHHPSVDVRCTFDEDAETIELEVTNTVQTKMRSREQDERIAEIREQIERGVVGKHVRREGGTGFLKLASVVRQSSKGRLEFGYQPDGRFRLLVVWSLIVLPSELDQSDASDSAR